jgi:hypothetical protein
MRVRLLGRTENSAIQQASDEDDDKQTGAKRVRDLVRKNACNPQARNRSIDCRFCGVDDEPRMDRNKNLAVPLRNDPDAATKRPNARSEATIARRWRPAPSTLSSGSAPSTLSSGSVSCFSASASSRSISLTPMIALSGVRSSWLMLVARRALSWLRTISMISMIYGSDVALIF